MALTIGAVRWDAVWAVGAQSHLNVQNNMSPAAFQHRAPFWADVYATNKIVLAPTQADMDAEIDFAADNGVDYWAFLLYNPSLVLPNATSASYAAYQASSRKNDVKWAMMRQCNHIGATGNYATQVAEMVTLVQTSNYQKVLTNRPLVFIFNANESLAAYWGGAYANLKAAIDAFRAAVQTAGLGNPYIVAISTYSAAQAVTDKTGIGADACTMYAVSNQTAAPQAYSALRSHIESSTWATLLASGGMLPMCSQGWDRRPRINRPVFWETGTQRPYFGHELYTTPPTPAEFQTHLEAAIAYLAAHPSECASESVLISSWSEFDEGGGICPTLGDPSGALLGAVLAARS